MSYSKCLTLLTNWPHDSPSPEDLADARCSLQSTSKELDMAICQLCNTCLWDMEPEDGPKGRTLSPLKKHSEIRIKNGFNFDILSTYYGVTTKMFTSITTAGITESSATIAERY